MAEPDPDPIKASYDVYIKPPMPGSRSLYILQFPNRSASQPYAAAASAKPLELRVKPRSGLLELDVPMDARRNYDREKGLRWGESLRRSNMVKGGGSHGLPGGFGIGGSATGGRGRGRGAAANIDDDIDAQERILADYENAIATERVLTKHTLGGQTTTKDLTTPQYMVGAFRKSQLHLTPVSQIVQMRPQFHHIDAVSEAARQTGASAAAVAGQRPGEARAVHMTVKAGDDGDETSDTMAERIRNAQEETWVRYKWHDEDSEEAWSKFEDVLFLHDPSGELPITPVGEGKGENPELTAEERNVPTLISTMNNSEYLDAISAPRDVARLSKSKKIRGSTKKTKGKEKDKGKGKEAEGQAGAESSEDGSDEDESSEEEL